MNRVSADSARVSSVSRSQLEILERRSLLSAGALDTTFGNDGLVTDLGYSPPGGTQRTAIAEDSKGRVLVSDTYTAGDGALMQITRLNTNGSVDHSFGDNGTFSSEGGRFEPGNPPAQLINQILPEPDGNILLIGALYIQQLNSSGVYTATLGGSSFGGAVAGVVLPDGKLMFVDGTSANVYRFNADGTLDDSFGTAGVLTLPSTQGPTAMQDIVLNSNDQPVLSIAVQINSTTSAFGTARLTTSGKLDTTYGNHGYALAPTQTLVTASSKIAVAPSGDIDQITTFAQNNGANIFVQIYSANGSSISGGRFNPPADADGDFNWDSLNDLTVQSGGKIIAVGSITQTDMYDDQLAVAVVDRFDAIPVGSSQAITLDPTFDGSGMLQLPFTGPVIAPNAEAVLLDASGRIVVSNVAGDSNGITVARVLTSGAPASISIPLTGTVIGSPGSFRNQGNVVARAFDGNLNTFFDAPQANGNWAGLNLGSPQTLAQVSYAPRAGWAQRMIGGTFQGSNTADFSSDVQTLYTITSAPPVGQLTTIGLGDAGPFQYVRYLGPAGSYGNIAELKFFRAPTALTGTAIGTSGSYQNQGSTIANAFDGDFSTFFDAPTVSGGWVGLDLGSAKMVTQVEFAPRNGGWSGYAQRMVGGEIQASNSANFSSGVVTLYTITSAPAADLLTTVSLDNNGSYRYYRYLGPAGSYCNIAELVFQG